MSFKKVWSVMGGNKKNFHLVWKTHGRKTTPSEALREQSVAIATLGT